ncbi:MAG TPA: hypothetical protein VNK96_00740 [Fimbriimonadales bacterium]|nr:hypothetical protein [Fimbriimonadales bacterium]
MKQSIHILTIITCCVVNAVAFGQEGGAYGAGGGGGILQEVYEQSANKIEERLRLYLTGNEIKNLLTPGEYSEWKMTMKEGQVVIAEARSDAFDPILEVVDAGGKVLATNDDRYPGDQRPLLLWRCEKEGNYALRARCFNDKFGGQFFLRFKIYDSISLDSEKMVEAKIETSTPFLFRISMKRGQIKKFLFEMPDNTYTFPSISFVISPTGLPDINLAQPLRPVIGDAIVAPVDGDYYMLAQVYTVNKTIRVGTKELIPTKLSRKDGTITTVSQSNVPVIWSLPVKAGEFLEVSLPELDWSSRLVVMEQPDFSKYDLKNPESNPFFPKTKQEGETQTKAFITLPARARDSRFSVFLMKRDANLWIASNAYSAERKEFTLYIKPAAKDFIANTNLESKLIIGKTDYWSFEANMGDVMTFSSTADAFAEKAIVYDPDLREIWSAEAPPDQTWLRGNIVFKKPGRYLLAISSIGNGGGGRYTVFREVFHAKEFKKGAPAQGRLEGNQVHVWKFTAKPDEPLLVRWKSSNWMYAYSIHDEMGETTNLPLLFIDEKNKYGILKVEKPKTFIIVMSALKEPIEYFIELNDLPGYKDK